MVDFERISILEWNNFRSKFIKHCPVVLVDENIWGRHCSCVRSARQVANAMADAVLGQQPQPGGGAAGVLDQPGADAHALGADIAQKRRRGIHRDTVGADKRRPQQSVIVRHNLSDINPILKPEHKWKHRRKMRLFKDAHR